MVKQKVLHLQSSLQTHTNTDTLAQAHTRTQIQTRI